MVGSVPPPGQSLATIRLRSKTSMESLDDAYVTPPRKNSQNKSPSTSTTGTEPSAKSFLGLTFTVKEN
jgi:hypothetical protein